MLWHAEAAWVPTTAAAILETIDKLGLLYGASVDYCIEQVVAKALQAGVRHAVDEKQPQAIFAPVFGHLFETLKTIIVRANIAH